MKLLIGIISFIIFLIVKDTKPMKKAREIKTNWIIEGLIIFFMLAFLLFHYFYSSVSIDDFNVIEKMHEEKGVRIYIISEDGQEKYLILKRAGILNKLFFEMKTPVNNMPAREIIDTFKYTHYIDMENSVITHTYEKRWDDILYYWIMSIIIVYNVRDFEKASKMDKIIVGSWLVMVLGMTVFCYILT